MHLFALRFEQVPHEVHIRRHQQRKKSFLLTNEFVGRCPRPVRRHIKHLFSSRG